MPSEVTGKNLLAAGYEASTPDEKDLVLNPGEDAYVKKVIGAPNEPSYQIGIQLEPAVCIGGPFSREQWDKEAGKFQVKYQFITAVVLTGQTIEEIEDFFRVLVRQMGCVPGVKE